MIAEALVTDDSANYLYAFDRNAFDGSHRVVWSDAPIANLQDKYCYLSLLGYNVKN